MSRPDTSTGSLVLPIRHAQTNLSKGVGGMVGAMVLSLAVAPLAEISLAQKAWVWAVWAACWLLFFGLAAAALISQRTRLLIDRAGHVTYEHRIAGSTLRVRIPLQRADLRVVPTARGFLVTFRWDDETTRGAPFFSLEEAEAMLRLLRTLQSPERGDRCERGRDARDDAPEAGPLPPIDHPMTSVLRGIAAALWGVGLAMAFPHADGDSYVVRLLVAALVFGPAGAAMLRFRNRLVFDTAGHMTLERRSLVSSQKIRVPLAELDLEVVPHGRGALLAMRGNDLSESWGPMRTREEAEAVLVLFRKLRAQSVDSDHRSAKSGSDVIHCTNPLTHYLRLGGAVILVGCAALVAQACMNGADQALVLLGLLTPFLLLAAIFCTWSERHRVELSGRVETVSRALWWIERRSARQFTRLRVEIRPSGYAVYGEQAPGEWVPAIQWISRSCAARLEERLHT